MGILGYTPYDYYECCRSYIINHTPQILYREPQTGPRKSRELGVRDLGSVGSLGNLMGSELWGSAMKAD